MNSTPEFKDGHQPPSRRYKHLNVVLRTAQMRRWRDLPYGLWVCGSGRQILFNRFYNPIWQKINGVVSVADQEEWVKDVIEQRWFYSDKDVIKHTVLCRRLRGILAAFKEGVNQ